MTTAANPSDVSVQICTLNNSDTIDRCVRSALAAGVGEVLVLDGGSTDGSPEIARNAGATVVLCGPVGIVAQRKQGYTQTTFPFTLILDADDVLPPTSVTEQLVAFESGGYDVLQFLVRGDEPRNWVERCWFDYVAQTVQPVSDTNTVGRPALYRTSVLRDLQLPQKIPFGVEDTMMARALQDKGCRQGVSAVETYREFPTELGHSMRKWRAYGHGYNAFCRQHPERKPNLWKHMLWTIPVKRTVKPTLSGNVMQPVFGVLFSAGTVQGWFDYGRRQFGTDR